SFNVTNKALFLHPVHKALAKAASKFLPLDINSLTPVILLQTLSDLSSARTHSPTTTTILTVSAPMTPVHCVPERSTSPPVPSPSQLMQFLKYAEMELHIENATMFERRLAGQHIGPDILPEIKDKILAVEIGILVGNIICLKKGSINWWKGPNAKSPTHPPQKMVAYERYHNGGGCHFTRPLMIAGDGNDDGPKDYDLWYQSTDHSAWLPVPKGYIICEDGNDDGLDALFK
ncbi:hypothetical protein PAXRUDRAFT_144441, partial [Paxillus rubicundulus Ve08.2h10]